MAESLLGRFSTLFLIVATVGLAPWGGPAQAELTRKDRAALLFSTQLSFDSNNVPIIPISITDQQDKIRLTSTGGIRVLPDGGHGSSIDLPGKKTWTARVEQSNGAKLKYLVIVGRHPVSEDAELRKKEALWEERRFKIRRIELGSVFGFHGRVLDDRNVLLAIDQAHASRAAATEAGEVLAGAYAGTEFAVHSEMVRYPTGVIVLTDGRTVIRNATSIWVQSLDGSPIRIHSVEYAKGFPWHGREDRSFHGELVFTVGRTGQMAAVNRLPAERILKSLVPSEIYTTSPMDTLKAQAVVARGELLAKIGHRHLADPYLICSSQHCQMYKGAGRENKRTNKAVDDTKGLMLFRDKQLVDAVYSSSCGGHTENNEDVWEMESKPYLRGQQDHEPSDLRYETVTDENVAAFLSKPPASFCKKSTIGSKNFRWTRTFSGSEVTKLVNKKHDVGAVTDLEIVARGVSGRVRRFRVVGEKGEVVIHRELPIRQLMGSLKSALFTIQIQRKADGRIQSVSLKGGGFGHGVGMCQTGAIGAAQSGMSFDHILQHYYQGSDIRTIY